MKLLAMPSADRPAVVMTCDVPRCLAMVRRAPRIIVPSCTPDEPDHQPIRIMTTLHYCDAHRASFQLAQYWTAAVRRRAEVYARDRRPHGFKPDFDNARVELLLVTTPEYRAFMRDQGINCVAG